LGEVKFMSTIASKIDITWQNGKDFANLKADLNTLSFNVNYSKL